MSSIYRIVSMATALCAFLGVAPSASADPDVQFRLLASADAPIFAGGMTWLGGWGSLDATTSTESVRGPSFVVAVGGTLTVSVATQAMTLKAGESRFIADRAQVRLPKDGTSVDYLVFSFLAPGWSAGQPPSGAVLHHVEVHSASLAPGASTSLPASDQQIAVGVDRFGVELEGGFALPDRSLTMTPGALAIRNTGSESAMIFVALVDDSLSGTPVPATGSITLVARACPAGVSVANASPEPCPIYPDGFPLMITDSAGNAWGMDARRDDAVAGHPTVYSRRELPLATYILTPAALPSGFNALRVVGGDVSGAPGAIQVTLSPEDPDRVLTVYLTEV